MKQRVNELCSRLHDDEAVLISGYPNIFYYSGFTSEDAYLYISKSSRILLTDSRYTVQAKQQAEDFDIIDIKCGFKSFFKDFGCKNVGIEEDVMSVALLGKLKALAPQICFAERGELISSLRRIKDEAEIKKITAAEKLGDDAFSYILPRIEAGRSEREIALELEFFMRSNGASGLSFETIAASGVRSAMPHGTASDKLLEHGDLFTLDFGCVLDGYCSDMTRTVAVGSIDERGRLVYNTVLAAQNAALQAAKPGMTGSSIDAAARDVIAKAGFGEYFGHSLGHSVGIQIHESPNLSPKSDAVIQPGNVITFEPGIYIEGFGGVRIEDVGVFTPTGVRNITHSPKELIIV